MRYAAFWCSMMMMGCNLILGQQPGIVVDAGADACACALDHATAQCVNGNCNITACDFGWDDVDRDPTTGCETANPFAVDHLALWLRGDKGVTTNDAGVVSWENQAPSKSFATVMMGAPTLATSSWPNADLPSVQFGGSDVMGVDLSPMMSTTGYTTFIAVAKYGSEPTNCVLGSPTYPTTGWVCGGNPDAAGTAFQLGWTSNTRSFSEPFCSATTITVSANSPTTYQPVVMTVWFDPAAPADYYSLDNLTVTTQVFVHALSGLSSPSMLGACPSGPKFTGLVGELVVYEALLTNDDRALVQTYLKARWKTH